MAVTRRFGSETALSRGLLLDAAAVLMVKEGYPAVTSRRVATEAGLNPALVHYYFHTMDDLFLALYRRRAEQGRALQAQALASEQPLWALWDLSRNPEGTALTMEFVALANHRKAIRAEIGTTVEQFRSQELKVLSEVFKRYAVPPEEIPTIVPTIVLASIARFLAAEASLGMLSGHAETIAFVERFIRQLEGERRS
jgi:AcrR family transcriptional regulator